MPGRPGVTPCYNREFMAEFVIALLSALRVFFRTRHDTALENKGRNFDYHANCFAGTSLSLARLALEKRKES